MVGDVGQNALTVFIYKILPVADKFDVIIVQPLGIFLFKLAAAWLLLVAFKQFFYPLAFVG